MKPVEFPEQNVVLGKDQPQYVPLPVYAAEDGRITCCLELTADEIQEVLRTGRVWLTQLTFGARFQPIQLSTHSPFVPVKGDLN